jgi:REP element-mobilizing transposase RayT
MIGQLGLTFKTWGGERKGAGRPPSRQRISEPHLERARFTRVTPFHITMRIAESVGSMRVPTAYHAVREALQLARDRTDFGVVHLSLERDHVHAIVEADHDIALAKGMQSLQGSLAKRLNRALGRRGAVFEDRYHPVAITSPTQARNAIAYVLNNFRKHHLDRGRETQFWDVDYYSSGPTFDGWVEYEATARPFALPAGYRPLPVVPARTWLIGAGWKRSGPISLHDPPGVTARR